MRKRNDGIRKRCGCARQNWPKCSHPWHFNYKHGDVHYRFSLDKEVGRRIEGKGEAEAEAERIRTAIRDGRFRSVSGTTPPRLDDEPDASSAMTFAQFADVWKERRGSQLVRPRDNDYRLGKILAFVLPGQGAITLGDKALPAITTDDIEAFRDWRKSERLSSVTVNHDLKLLRKMWNWGIRKGYTDRSPFKIGSEAAISLDKEIPRDWRFASEEDEQKLLDAANEHLRGIVTALLDTACRLGEILSLQWRDVNLPRREMTIRAEKAKTRTGRLVPISTRLASLLEMRKLDTTGREFPPEAYVFGDATGRRVKSIRTAWENATEAAGLKGVQLRDLRHEAGSRFDEAGVPISYTSKILGHTNLNTTSRYLNIHRRGLQDAMQKLEVHRPSVAQPLHTDRQDAPANVQPSTEAPASNLPVIQ
jgi:integrase